MPRSLATISVPFNLIGLIQTWNLSLKTSKPTGYMKQRASTLFMHVYLLG